MSEPHLVLSGVHRHYGQGDQVVRVLEAADLTVRSGELVALVAPSGAGKSTLLHLSGLLESPQDGEVSIMGIPTSKLGDRGRTQLRRSTVGYVYQFHHLLPEFTAVENVSMPQLIAGKSPSEAYTRSMELLGLLGVAPRAEHRPAELSGGEQQRVAIARAAANRPRVILADEPTGNLDPETSDVVFAALADLIKNEGAAALIATHNHDLARRADRIVTLKGGLVLDHTL
ncbi:MAG TPA: ABC transporter ATP-binding protein [Devosia sp.]|jgi:lipoprotein-releasing system ATP-binding protein|nr:ABC transporter ATP-binding protein [Devosia sp.]